MKYIQITSKKIQLLVLYIIPIIASFISLKLNLGYLPTMLLFWGVPAVLLSYIAKDHIKKAFMFAIIGTPFLMCLDLIFYLTRQWYVVSSFTNRLFGIVAWDDAIYFFLWVYFPVLFWEYFFEKQTHEPLFGKRMFKLTAMFVFVSVGILLTYFYTPYLAQIQYFYLISTIIFIIVPIIIGALINPKLEVKFLATGIYFAFNSIIYEVTAISLNQWYYPSTQFIGWVDILGQRFPVEELLAWILLGSTAILTWYEYFDDDNK